MRHQDSPGLKKAKRLVLIVALVAAGWPNTVPAEEPFDTLRRWAIDSEPTPPKMANVENKDLRRARNYPEQPPTIPHDIRDYQIDLNTNKCLTCHSRAAVEQSQAPMVSVTHFMDRDGQIRAAVSARRFFCLQCHVPQTDARPLVGNNFRDVDAVIKGVGSRKGR